MKELVRHWKQNFNIDHLLLLIIVLAGVVLRFYNYSEAPYSFDEFSALFRTRFDNFSDLIYYGVKTTDTHPAGVQVFMFAWVKLFGESEMVVKFPFVLFGLLSIFLGYMIGAKWFNSTVGLIVALFLSVLQYPITYSLFARPYISGLFLSLLMVWFWTHVVFYPKTKSNANYIGFIITGALCAYNHHFSLFLIGLVGISGLFFLSKETFKRYFIACVLIFVLYIPHLPIFFVQLNRGGVEDWLKKPQPDFILDYGNYILHFSNMMFVLVSILFLAGFFYIKKTIRISNKYRILAFTWFAITYLTAYFYSVHVNALLQFSILIFVFPFLIMLVFSFYGNAGPWLKTLIVFAFISISVFTLITNRQHYRIFYQSIYKEVFKESDRIHHTIGKDNVTTIIEIPPKIKSYYIDKFQLDESDYMDLDTAGGFIQFRETVKHLETDYLILAYTVSTEMEYRLIAEEEFPYLIKKIDWYKGNLYVYSKSKPTGALYQSPDSTLFYSMDKYDAFDTGWSDVVLHYQLIDGINYPGDKILRLNKDFEYSPEFLMKLSDISSHQSNEIIISVDAYMPVGVVSPTLICEFRSEGKVLTWKSTEFIRFIDQPQRRLKVHLAVRLLDLYLKYPDVEVSTYIWNQDFEEVIVDDFSIEVRKGNPIVYSLFQDF